MEGSKENGCIDEKKSQSLDIFQHFIHNLHVCMVVMQQEPAVGQLKTVNWEKPWMCFKNWTKRLRRSLGGT